METVFYFAEPTVTLPDVADVARAAGFRLADPDPDGRGGAPHLHVYFEGRHYWEVGYFDAFDSLEDADLAKLRAMGPVTLFYVEHHTWTLPRLREFLKRLLTRIGGRVARDDAWETFADLAAIEAFDCSRNATNAKGTAA